MRIVVSIVVGLLVWIVCVPMSFAALLGFPPAFDGTGTLNTLGVIFALLVSIFWFSVFLRHRWPWVPFIIGAVLASAWGDGTLLLIGMFHLIVRSPRRQAVIATIIGSILILVGVLRLYRLSPAHNPFGILFLTEPDQIPGVETSLPADESVFGMNMLTVIAGLIGLAVSLGFGYLLRRTRRMKAVESFAEAETQRNEDLSAQLARKSERELLARELHDTLSHRLSVISLHSGALETGDRADPEVSATAHALRTEARASLDDLRHLVGGVREGTLGVRSPPQPALTPPNSASLSSLPALIRSVQATGTEVRPSLIMQDVESAPTVLHRAVYRVIQEALTNAMKHAPGFPVTLMITTSAAQGCHIVVSNPLPNPQTRFSRPDPSNAQGLRAGSSELAASGSGAGVESIRERARMLGGSASSGPRGETFVIEVSFPPFPVQQPR
ncbi:two-component sensor histidine kinase [Brevibacterium aurantiacum]|uniref:histidine kinase n=1 Tax=Brevibacterium aurantiacum TaxID=273384 RepID=A0A556CNN3_BREAU|nr:two-component sensor histidine kinase [Brevibacterium aurantiacum]